MKHDLQFHHGYYNDPAMRLKLNALAYEVFGLDFSPWNDLGYAFEEYTPFSYLDGDRVVANVSASPINLIVEGEPVAAVQIGTVATLPEFRGQGLIRSLFKKALAHWEATHPLTFLFANESTADFYQRFGFRRATEHWFAAPVPRFSPPKNPARRLSLRTKEHRDLLHDFADARAPVSQKLGVVNDAWLLLFHAAVAYPKHLRYIEALNVVVISTVRDSTLRLVDVIGETIPPLCEIYPYVGSSEIEAIEFGFTPDLMGVEAQSPSAADSLFFVRGELAVEGERFLYPFTGQT
jgi:predicted N-acetyltransferase YhbS